MGGYTIRSWAEQVPNGKWHGLASIVPPIPNTWTGGPDGHSLVIDGEAETAQVAELKAMDEAIAALRAYVPDLERPGSAETPLPPKS
jgi:hypothetical protein